MPLSTRDPDHVLVRRPVSVPFRIASEAYADLVPSCSPDGPTNTFFRQIRNLVLDMTQVPATFAATGIHWPTAQTTSLQNIVFNMNSANGTIHQGLFIEEGSGGFMTDL